MDTKRFFVRMVAIGLSAAVTGALVLGIAAAPASAETGEDGPEPEMVEVSGSFTGSGSLTGPRCPFFHQVVVGNGDWSGLGASTFNLDFCSAPRGSVGDVTFDVSEGVFSITTSEGTLSGPMTGTVDAGLPFPATEFPFEFELVIDAGTDRFEDAEGTLVMEGVFGLGAVMISGDISGTVTIPPPTPESIGDCLHGGWTTVVDGEGNPFPNQGLCIAYVVRHD